MLAAFIVWMLLTMGLTYVASRASILNVPRSLLVLRFPLAADLLSCDQCTSFWAGQMAAAVILAHLRPDWYIWIYGPPVAGFCAVGLTWMLEKLAHEPD